MRFLRTGLAALLFTICGVRRRRCPSTVCFGLAFADAFVGEVDWLQLLLGLGLETRVVGEPVRVPDLDQLTVGTLHLLKRSTRLHIKGSIAFTESAQHGASIPRLRRFSQRRILGKFAGAASSRLTTPNRRRTFAVCQPSASTFGHERA